MIFHKSRPISTILNHKIVIHQSVVTSALFLQRFFDKFRSKEREIFFFSFCSVRGTGIVHAISEFERGVKGCQWFGGWNQYPICDFVLCVKTENKNWHFLTEWVVVVERKRAWDEKCAINNFYENWHSWL